MSRTMMIALQTRAGLVMGQTRSITSTRLVFTVDPKILRVGEPVQWQLELANFPEKASGTLQIESKEPDPDSYEEIVTAAITEMSREHRMILEAWAANLPFPDQALRALRNPGAKPQPGPKSQPGAKSLPGEVRSLARAIGPKSQAPPPRSVPPPPKSLAPPPKSLGPAPKSLGPAPKSLGPAPKSILPPTRSQPPAPKAAPAAPLPTIARAAPKPPALPPKAPPAPPVPEAQPERDFDDELSSWLSKAKKKLGP